MTEISHAYAQQLLDVFCHSLEPSQLLQVREAHLEGGPVLVVGLDPDSRLVLPPVLPGHPECRIVTRVSHAHAQLL